MKKFILVSLLTVIMQSNLVANDYEEKIELMCGVTDSEFNYCPKQIFKTAIDKGCKTIVIDYNRGKAVFFSEVDPYSNDECYVFYGKLIDRMSRSSGLFMSQKFNMNTYVLNKLPRGHSYVRGKKYFGVVKGDGVYRSGISKGNVISIIGVSQGE